MAGKRRFVATSDPAVFHEVKGVGGADAVWTSKVLDAGPARRPSAGSPGAPTAQLELATRSGNTATPDGTWSAWSAALAAPGDVTEPAGALRADPRPLVARSGRRRSARSTLCFVTDNARAIDHVDRRRAEGADAKMVVHERPAVGRGAEARRARCS